MFLSFFNKFAIDLLWALIVFFITAHIIGQERKHAWFQKRTKYSFFNRRGFIGESLHFGYPKTKEGVGVTIIITVCIAVGWGIVYYL